MPKKILFISHTSGIGGAERCFGDLVCGINRRIYEPIALLPNKGPLGEIISKCGIKPFLFNSPWWIGPHGKIRTQLLKAIFLLPIRIKIIRSFIRSMDIKLVYTNTITVLDGAIAAKMEKIPHIWHIHEIISKNKNLKSIIPKRLIRVLVTGLAKKIIVPSGAARLDISSTNKDRIIIVRNGLDMTEFLGRITGKNFRHEFAIEKEAKIVMVIGDINEMKGIRDIVEAAKEVCSKITNCLFVLIGEGKKYYIDIIKRKIDESAITRNRFLFLGFRHDIADLLNSADVMLCASKVESYSMSILEAMAASRPVVATRCGGPEEIVMDGRTGILVPVAGIEQMSDAIINVLLDEAMAKKMGQLGRKELEKRFSKDRYIKEIEGIIAEII
jgi:glycosyltransferase involved in cell wall biosynthesis